MTVEIGPQLAQTIVSLGMWYGALVALGLLIRWPSREED